MTSYPNSIKTFTTKVDNVDTVMAVDVNDVQNEIAAIETELGTLPKGTKASVAARLATIIEDQTHASTAKTALADADEIPLIDSAAANGLKKLTFATVKSLIRTYNLIINGDMNIAQRGTSKAGIIASGYHTIDRMSTQLQSLGTWSQAQKSDDFPIGSGFRSSLKMLCTTANAAPAATSFLFLSQTLEGQNVQSFKKGTSSAKPMTLSFWAKSNVTGTYIADLVDGDNSRLVSIPYSISVANTWEKKAITFPADVIGALDNDSMGSLTVSFWLGAGSQFTSGSPQPSWGTYVAANRAVGQVNLASSVNNYYLLTGVQLEVGDVATDFAFEDYGDTLRKCLRYFWNPNNGVPSNSGADSPVPYPVGVNCNYVYNGTTHTSGGGGQTPPIILPVPMRAAPTCTFYGTVTGKWFQQVGATTIAAAMSLLMSTPIFIVLNGPALSLGDVAYRQGGFTLEAEL